MKKLLFLIMLIFSINIFAFTTDTPLSSNEAFELTATAKDYQTILLQWHIAPTYYLYKSKFSFHIVKPNNVLLAEPLYPSGDKPLKTAIGTYHVYANHLIIPVPIINATQKKVLLQVHYQGCSHAGYCYPPTNKLVAVNLASDYMRWSTPLKINVPAAKKIQAKKPSTPDNPITRLLAGKHVWTILLGFLTFGILISFTPCVLPMIPILSGMIIGQKKMTHAHGFLLSLFYVLGMAITYAAAGLLFGFIGSSIQTSFQQPWIIITFSLLFVAMACSLFGFFNLQLPEKLRTKIANSSNDQKRGTYFGAAVMGCLSTLILSPCVTPPLVAVLGFISQTGNTWLGGSSLFVMGLGMGFPLLLIGALGPKVLPKSGAWMNTVKYLMGILMLAVAIFMAQRVLPGIVSMLLWAALSIGTGLYFGALSTATSKWLLVKKSIGILFFVYGILLINGAYQGNHNPLRVIQHYNVQAAEKALHFDVVHSQTSLNTALKRAAPNQLVMIDFYADWCVACQELDADTFSDPAVQQQLSHALLIRADVTRNTDLEKQLSATYHVVAPPTILFFKNGTEIKNSRIIGFIGANKLLAHMESLEK